MLPELYIVGAGGFGRELYTWLKDLPGWDKDWKLAGYLDDNPSALEGFEYDARVVAPIKDFQPKPGQLFICGLGNVDIKKNACQPLLERGAKFMTLVHPTAVVGANVSLGEGVVICPRVTLTSDIQIGDMAMVNLHCTVAHDARVGAWSVLCPSCDLTGGVQLGADVFLGVGAKILPGMSVGEGAYVGAGSVVFRDVKEGQRVFGNPARPFRSA